MTALVLLVNIIAGVLLLAIYYYKKTFDYFKTRGVPFIKPSGFLEGNTGGLGTKYHTFAIMKQVYEELKGKGPFGGIFVSYRPTAIITDLELVKYVLVKDFNYFPNRGIYYNAKHDPISEHISNIEDDQWKNVRSKLTPIFTSGKLKVMFDTILNISETLMTTIERESSGTESLEIKDILARFTCDVIGNVAFGLECDSLNDKSAKFFEMAVRSMDSFDFVQRHALMEYRNLARALRIKLTPDDVPEFYNSVVKSIVEYRANNSDSKRADLMNILIGMMENDQMSMELATAQAFFYFIAGYETTSTTLAFCIYELSQNQKLQEKARQHVTEILAGSQNELTYESVNEMTYIDKIIDETLRKWPPSVTVQREASADYKVPNSKHVIEKGCAVIVPVYGIHHDESIYPEPEKFDPSRFDAVEVEKRHPFAYLPFGTGPRACPGIRFSMLEMKICLASLLTTYQFSLDYEQTEFPIKISPSNFMMTPDKGVFVKFTKL